MTKKKSILAWHFVYDGWKLRDGTKVEPGLRLKHFGDVRMCQSGYHASRRLIDAFAYAESNLLCRVRCSGDIIEQPDKLVCSDREVLWCLDAEWYLHEFACRAAEKAMKWSKRKPDPRSVAAIYAKRAWLRGEISDEELASAKDAAWVSGKDSTWVLAMDGAWAAASHSAWAAAYASTHASTRASARDKLNTMLMRLIMSAEWEDES